MSKRILIATGIFTPDIGGPASYSKALAHQLAKKKHAVSVITYSSVRSFADDKKFPFRVIRIWSLVPKGIRHLLYLCRIYFTAKQHDVILALNAVSAGVPAVIAAKLRKKKLFVKVVGDAAWERAIQTGATAYLINDFQKFPRPGWAGVLHRSQVWVCKNADRVIVPSEYLAEMVKGWGIDAGKITVIYNGSDFKPAKMVKEDARKKIGIAGNIILSVGRLVPWKGFRMLIKIMPQLLQINQFFRLVIVGGGPEEKTLRIMIKNLGLERKVYLVGKKPQEELAIYLAATDIFVLNTGYEGFSHQILEAMIAGVPVVTTAVGGNREIIQQGENGFLVKYNDEFNLIEAIKSVWREAEMREHFIKEAKEAAEHFSVEKMFTETIKLLTE